MKKILFVINTMGRAGAEMALLELLRCLVKDDGLELSLFVLTGQGEMISRVPEEVKLLNKNFDECSVLLPEGKRHLMKTSAKALFKNGSHWLIRLPPYPSCRLHRFRAHRRQSWYHRCRCCCRRLWWYRYR